MDTSAYIAFLEGHHEVKAQVQRADEIFLNPVILGEFLSGFVMGKKEKRNRALLQDFMRSPRVGLLEIDQETSERYAVILNHLRRKGTPIPTNDIWIAASAMQYGLIVVTTDRHYLDVPQVITKYIEATSFPAKQQAILQK